MFENCPWILKIVFGTMMHLIVYVLGMINLVLKLSDFKLLT